MAGVVVTPIFGRTIDMRQEQVIPIILQKRLENGVQSVYVDDWRSRDPLYSWNGSRTPSYGHMPSHISTSVSASAEFQDTPRLCLL
jgi:hypothetical protein